MTLLLGGGADVNVQNKDGKSALHMTRNKEVLKLILEHKCEPQVDLRDNAGKSALIAASERRNLDLEALKLLLDSGGQRVLISRRQQALHSL